MCEIVLSNSLNVVLVFFNSNLFSCCYASYVYNVTVKTLTTLSD